MNCPKNLWTTIPKWNARYFLIIKLVFSTSDYWLDAFKAVEKETELHSLKQHFILLNFMQLLGITWWMKKYFFLERALLFSMECRKPNWNEMNSAIEK